MHPLLPPRPVRIGALLLLAAGPAAAGAQARTFDACVFGVFQTCTALTLTTAAVSGGTAVTVAVRQSTRSARATGLMSLAFHFAAQGAADPGPLRPALGARAGGAVTPVDGTPQWTFHGGAGRLDLLHDAVSPDVPAARTQFVAGCAGGNFAGGFLATALSTCLPGDAYVFAFTTRALFSAADVTGFGFDLYAGADDDAPMGRAVSCAFGVPGEAGDSGCLDVADVTNPVVPAAPAVVPEPATLLLAGAGLAALAGAARRRLSR